MERILNRCPICGGSLYLDTLYQYSIYTKISKRGRECKKSRREDNGPIDASAIRCENNDFCTDYQFGIVKPADYKATVFSRGDVFYIDDDE